MRRRRRRRPGDDYAGHVARRLRRGLQVRNRRPRAGYGPVAGAQPALNIRLLQWSWSRRRRPPDGDPTKGAPMSARARLWLDLALFGALFLATTPRGPASPCTSGCASSPSSRCCSTSSSTGTRRSPSSAASGRSCARRPRSTSWWTSRCSSPRSRRCSSGLLISQSVARVFGVIIMPDSLWVSTHSWSADATILLLLVHFALHWRWIVNASQAGAPRPLREDDPVVAIRWRRAGWRSRRRRRCSTPPSPCRRRPLPALTQHPTQGER